MNIFNPVLSEVKNSFNWQASGLSQWVATQLEFFEDWNKWVILFIFCYITVASTEVVSNTAVATILMRIMVQLVRVIKS